MHISLGGQSIETSERPSIGISVVVAVAAALVILLIVFGGALLSSLLPLVTAGLALVTATSLIELLSHAFDVASVSSELAILIGLGVGVDYGLFIISRHRSAVKDGLSYSDAAALAVRTSGRTVLRGITVCIALLGQFALGVRFLYGPSLGAAIAVALTMTASLTFLPAMLGFLGPRVLSRRERSRLGAGSSPRRRRLLAPLGPRHPGPQGPRSRGRPRRRGRDPCYLTHVVWVVLSCLCCPACRGDMRRPPLDDLRVPSTEL